MLASCSSISYPLGKTRPERPDNYGPLGAGFVAQFE